MHLEMIDERCMSLVRERRETIGYSSIFQIFFTYRNFMGSSSFRKLSVGVVDKVVKKNN